MQVYNKLKRVIIFLFCLTVSSQGAFAQGADDLKLEIYSKLRDRRCSTMTLDKCNCPDAKEMRAYIDALLETGVAKDEIFYKAAKKFSLSTILDKEIKAKVQERLIKEAGGKIPQAVLEPGNFSLGEVIKGEGKIKKTFKIANKGTEKLIISNIKVSCTCVTASLNNKGNKSPSFGTQGAPSGWQAVIEPGESAELEAEVDLNHPAVKVGKLIRDINITTNDIINPELTARIEAEVKESQVIQQAAEKEGPEFSGKIEDGVRAIEVKASRYKFQPDPVVVGLGEKVRLIVTSLDVTHGLAISEFKVNASVGPEKITNIEFTADKKGTFRMSCSVYCGAGHNNMRGSLVVK